MSAAPILQPETPFSAVPPELVRALYAPLPPEAIRPHPTKDYLSSVKAIFVIERLNEVFGIGGWTYSTHVVERGKPTMVPDKRQGAAPGAMKEKPGMIVVRVVLTVAQYGIRLEQFGGSDNEDRGDAYKGAVTDAISKIGSYLGIAIDVYKGGGPTKVNPRGSRVTQPQMITDRGSAEASAAVAKAKIAAMQKPQPAVEILEEAPPEDATPWTYCDGEPEPPSQLEEELRASIIAAELRRGKKPGPGHFVMLQAFGHLKSRYQSIGMMKTYYALLGQFGVQHSNQFPQTDDGVATARMCYKAMSLDVANREARRARA